MKRVLLFLIVIALLIPFAGCGKKKPVTPNDTTGSSQSNGEKPKYDENGFETDDLNDDQLKKEFSDVDEIKILHWTEHQIGEFNPDKDSKDTIDKSIIQRDQKVSDRLGGVSFKWIGEKGHWSAMNSFINKATTAYYGGEEDRYDLIGVYSQTAAALAPKGLVLNLLDEDSKSYLNLSKPWWPDSLLENSMVADKLWFVSGDICTSFTSELINVMFNKAFFEDNENGGNPLYELVDNGDWTIETMMELSKDLYWDQDEDGKKSNGDRYGIVIPWYVYVDSFFYGSNLIMVENDEHHNLSVSSSYVGEKADNLTEKLKTIFHTSDYGYLTQEGQAVNRIFARDDAAFLVAPPVMMLTTPDFSDRLELRYGILPMPKYDSSQKEYKSVHSNFLSLFSIFAGCNKEQANRASAVLECLASEGFRTISPVIFEKCLKLKYANDSDTGRMYDLIRAGAVFDTGRIFASAGLDGITQDKWQLCVINNKIWGAISANVDAQLQELLDDMTENFRNMEQ